MEKLVASNQLNRRTHLNIQTMLIKLSDRNGLEALVANGREADDASLTEHLKAREVGNDVGLMQRLWSDG